MNTGKCSVEVFSRVTGFFRPVQSWNKGKTEEFKDRKTYKLNEESTAGTNADSRITKFISG